MSTGKVLLMVDVQNDFCPGGTLPVTDGDKVVEPLNRMCSYIFKMRWSGWTIFSSRDWHPAVTNHFKAYGGLWPVHCVRDTIGAKFHNGLVINGIIVSKGFKKDTDDYSDFDGFTDQFFSFDEVLKSLGVTEIYVGGLATDYCVKATCLDGIKLGYKVYLLLDACRAVNVNSGDGDKAVEEMRNAGVIITNTDEVVRG